jgi:chromosome segregation ATPase
MRRIWIMIGVFVATSVSAEETTPAAVVIQQEAHLLVESLKRRFPETKFTFVLSNESELANVVAQNLSRLQQIQQMESDLQELRSRSEQAEEENKRVQKELQETMDRVRKLYLLLDDLQTQRKTLSEDLEQIRKLHEREQRAKDVLVAEVAHYRGVVSRAQQALQEIPEFVPPQRLSNSLQETGTTTDVAVRSVISDSSTAGLSQK